MKWKMHDAFRRYALLSLFSAFLLSAILAVGLLRLVTANPITVPTLLMPEEHINATIFRDDGGGIKASVNGTYLFTNVEVNNVTMYYPVPPGSTQISVEINGTPLNWGYSNMNYTTVIGDFPTVNWTIKPVPENFTITTYYEQPVPQINGNYTFLYAMGTGRYLEYYDKETKAYFTISISKNVAFKEEDINIYTVGYNATTEKWIWKPADFTVIQEDETWIITLTVVSEPFTPLMEDLLLTIRKPLKVSLLDVDPNTLNLKSKGKWITCYIELPEGYDVNNINVSTILLNDTIKVDPSAPTSVGDHDDDGIPDLMVKFDRAKVIDFILDYLYENGNVTLKVTGELMDGKTFEGVDTIRAIHRSELMKKLVELDAAWPYASPQEREAIMTECSKIDAQWLYAI